MTDFAEFMNGFEGGGSFENLPSGTYDVEVAKMDISKKPDEVCIKVAYKVQSGPHAGGWLNDNFMMLHSNPKRVNVGKDRLYQLQQALNLVGNFDTEAYKGKRLTAVAESDGKYTNIVKFAPASAPVEGGDAPF